MRWLDLTSYQQVKAVIQAKHDDSIKHQVGDPAILEATQPSFDQKYGSAHDDEGGRIEFPELGNPGN